MRFLAINDVYTLENLSRLKHLYVTKEREAKGLADDVTVLRTLAGDFLSPNVLSPIDSGYAFMRCFNAVGVTHLCFGNHEANISINQLEERMHECKGKLLNTNVPNYSRPKLPVYDIVEAGHLRLGLFGLVTNEKTVFVNSTFKKFPILDPIEVALDMEKKLREEHGCTHVVALTHQSIARDRELATATTLNAILGGHEHTPFDELVEGCRIIKTGKDAETGGVLDLYFSGKNETTVFYHTESTADYDEDHEIADLVDICMDSVSQLGTEIMIDTKKPLSAKGTRFRPTALGSLFGTYIKRELETEVAMINGATIKARSDFASGQVSLADLNTVLPFPTKLISTKIPGHVLQHAVRFSRSNRPWEAEKRGFLQLDGEVVIKNPTVSGVYGAKPDDIKPEEFDTIVEIDGEPFEPERVYTVALPRNLLNGFCEIEPLMEYSQNNPGVVPDADNFIPAKDVIVRRCARRLWAQLGDFELIDLDKDGFVTRPELKQRIKDMVGVTPSEAILDGLIDALDVNRDGIISHEEYTHLRNKL